MSSSSVPASNVRLIWHRRDLRLTDNSLYSDLDYSTSTISLFVFDESQFTPCPSTCLPSEWDAVTVGPHAARLVVEAVTELRGSIQGLGGQLLVRLGDPVVIVPQIAKLVGATQVCWNEEPGVYETAASQQVRQALDKYGIDVTTHVGYTLYHPNDLPSDAETWTRLAHPKQRYKSKKKSRNHGPSAMNENVSGPTTVPLDDDVVNVSPQRWKGMPRVMGDFRRAARTFAQVRPTTPAPSTLSTPVLQPNLDVGDIPTLPDLMESLLSSCDRPIMGMKHETIDFVVKAAQERCNDATATHGGERCALNRLHHFVNGGHAATADRSLADVSDDNSSRLSVHLALGTISPRTIYEAADAAGEPCQWLMSHLEMRDFFLYTAFSAGSRLYRRQGMPVVKKADPISWSSPSANEETEDHWKKWAVGETNLPLVDAAMRELLLTGYCSNRVRQNAASVLTKDLGIDWRAGAEWFQFLLEDHCVGANWGNWMYFSGVGSDPKQRHFRTVSQALRYDPSGTYVVMWLPKLHGVSDVEARLRPWEYIAEWGAPIVDPNTQLTWSDLQSIQNHGRLCQNDDESDGNT